MKYRIETASSNPKVRKPYSKATLVEKPTDWDENYYYYTIEIDTIEDFKAIQDETLNHLVIDFELKIITIYDDYME